MELCCCSPQSPDGPATSGSAAAGSCKHHTVASPWQCHGFYCPHLSTGLPQFPGILFQFPRILVEKGVPFSSSLSVAPSCFPFSLPPSSLSLSVSPLFPLTLFPLSFGLSLNPYPLPPALYFTVSPYLPGFFTIPVTCLGYGCLQTVGQEIICITEDVATVAGPFSRLLQGLPCSCETQQKWWRKIVNAVYESAHCKTYSFSWM